MKPIVPSLDVNRRALLSTMAVLPTLSGAPLTTSAGGGARATADAEARQKR
jgi:hypothetical protein